MTQDQSSRMNFSSFVVASFLRAAGWPQQKGLVRKRLVVNAIAADGALRHLVEIGAGIGASDPGLAARLLANVFFIRDWRAKPPADLVNELLLAEIAPPISMYPYEIVFEGNFPVFAKHMSEVTWENLAQNYAAYGILFGRAVVWGIQNRDAMEVALNLERSGWEAGAGSARSAGLNIPEAFPYATNQAFYDACRDVANGYEMEMGPLADPPVELESELLARRG